LQDLERLRNIRTDAFIYLGKRLDDAYFDNEYYAYRDLRYIMVSFS
jgi:hypothetical protein